MRRQSAPVAAGTGFALPDAVRAGSRRAVARAISIVERGGAEAEALLAALNPGLDGGHRIGITGPPGAGKSTLTAALARELLDADARVGIVAVDPSSPFTRGAVLGDRVRMVELEGDERVFIRSMAHRGFGGGLAACSHDVADVMTAAGFDYILIESLGVGQAEIAVRRLVDTTVVVLVPESGDQVQAIKAGLMEIADLYVVNKADRPGSQALLAAVQGNLRYLHHADPEWSPEVLTTVATAPDGVDGVAAAVGRHWTHLSAAGRLAARRAERLRTRLRQRVEELVDGALWNDGRRQMLAEAVDAMARGDFGIDEATRRILGDFYDGGAP